LFSHHVLYLRLQVIKLLASLTYPLKITKGQSTTHPHLSYHLLIDVLLCIRLVMCYRCCGCGWHLKLKHLKLLLESGDRRCSLLEVKVLLLDMVLKVYNGVSMLVHHRASGV
jgi:hypothetical protein